MTSNLDAQKKNDLVSSTALNKIGTAEDVAKTVIFLASDMSDYISGANIAVDGCEQA